MSSICFKVTFNYDMWEQRPLVGHGGGHSEEPVKVFNIPGTGFVIAPNAEMARDLFIVRNGSYYNINIVEWYNVNINVTGRMERDCDMHLYRVKWFWPAEDRSGVSYVLATHPMLARLGHVHHRDALRVEGVEHVGQINYSIYVNN